MFDIVKQRAGLLFQKEKMKSFSNFRLLYHTNILGALWFVPDGTKDWRFLFYQCFYKKWNRKVFLNF